MARAKKRVGPWPWWVQVTIALVTSDCVNVRQQLPRETGISETVTTHRPGQPYNAWEELRDVHGKGSGS